MLEQLLGQTPKSQFMEEHFLRLPYSQPQGAAGVCDLGTWETIERLLARPDADALAVRAGQRWPENRSPSASEAKQLHDDGYTLLVRHAERHDPRLKQLADEFEKDFRAPVDVHLYATPAGQFGFGWHYDAEDVFILQTQGSKEYSLRKNTVNPWPLAETLPADMKYERELMPLIKCLLEAGDWLYIPNGYWHATTATSDSISLAVGVMAPSALDAFDFLRERLLESMLWRQRLPTIGEASTVGDEELRERYRELFADLADDLTRAFRDEAFLRSFLER